MAQFLSVIQRRRAFSMLVYTVEKQHDSCGKQAEENSMWQKERQRKSTAKRLGWKREAVEENERLI